MDGTGSLVVFHRPGSSDRGWSRSRNWRARAKRAPLLAGEGKIKTEIRIGFFAGEISANRRKECGPEAFARERFKKCFAPSEPSSPVTRSRGIPCRCELSETVAMRFSSKTLNETFQFAKRSPISGAWSLFPLERLWKSKRK